MERKQIDTAGRTENFFTRNVKLLTFFICVAVILAPFVIVYINDVIEEKREASLPDMTVDELVLIAEKSTDLRQRDLAKFEGYRTENEEQGMKYAMYRIPVLHEERMVLSISFDASLDYVFYLQLMNLETQEKLDLLTEPEKLEKFLTTPAN